MGKKFILIGCVLLGSCISKKNQSQTKFQAGEHVYIGNKSYDYVCSQVGNVCPTNELGLQLQTKNKEISFSYGELVAFSGDFYQNPQKLYEEEKAFWGKFHDNDVETVKERFSNESEVIQSYLHGHEIEYPNYNPTYLFSIPEYLHLAQDNTSHFGFYNMLVYIKYHGEALDLAMKANILKNKGFIESSDVFLEKAMFYNAFADHFLTDAFAAGHVRVPHKQTMKWVEDRGFSQNTAGVLTKILHDRDGRINKPGEHGLEVMNADGQKWSTRCDSQLFLQPNFKSEAIRQPVQAVISSLQEIMSTYSSGVKPEGVYTATNYVPFPDMSLAPLLTERFPPDLNRKDAEKILSEMSFYMRTEVLSGIIPEIVQMFFLSIPQIMDDFRQQVKAAVEKDPTLKLRLPEAYLQAFMNIE